MEAAGRRYGCTCTTGCSWPNDRWPVLSCAARSVADGGRRPTILGVWVLLLTLGFALLD